jgi:phage repressor protein C with HTH and peptisase S24 domain
VTVSFSAVPLLAHPIAAGAPLAIEQDEVSGYKAFDDRILKGLEPLCLRVGPREESMLPTIQPRDLLLIDRTPSRLAQPQDGRVYALNLPDSDDEAGPWGGTVKRLWRKGDHLVAVPDNIAKEPRVLHMQQSIATYVVGEVVWVGRELAARKGRP